MILVDTSAWIEFSRGSGSEVDRHLAALIETQPHTLAWTEPILMELLAGGPAPEKRVTERVLRSFTRIAFDPVSDFAGAARIYQICRSEGVTVRGLVDCMIAQVALRAGAAILTGDRDFRRIGEVMPLTLTIPVEGGL